MDLTSDDVQDILRLADGLPFGELRLETARFRLSLRRTAPGEWSQEMQVLTAPQLLPGDAGSGEPPAREPPGPEPPGPEPPGPEQAAPEALLAGHGGGADDQLTEVRAPLLGTFYRAPRPGAPPFVAVGSPVGPDTVVCIIETMKLMNSVTAGVSGTVADIVLANAQFAEQGTVLMRIRASQ